MKPFKPKRSHRLTLEEERFNFRLSRARHCVENAFGILSQKWACIESELHCQPNAIKNIVAACCLLHNFMLNQQPEKHIPDKYKDSTENSNYVNGSWRRNNFRQQFSQRNTAVTEATMIRNVLKDYVNSVIGKLSFQNRGRRLTL